MRFDRLFHTFIIEGDFNNNTLCVFNIPVCCSCVLNNNQIPTKSRIKFQSEYCISRVSANIRRQRVVNSFLYLFLRCTSKIDSNKKKRKPTVARIGRWILLSVRFGAQIAFAQSIYVAHGTRLTAFICILDKMTELQQSGTSELFYLKWSNFQ